METKDIKKIVATAELISFYEQGVVKRIMEIIDKKEILKWVRKDLIVQEDCMETLGRLVSLVVEHIKAKIKEEFENEST